MTNKPTWEREFGVLFISKENGKEEPKVYCHPDGIKQFISTKLAEQRQEIVEIIIENYIPGHSILTPTLDRIINLIKQ